LFAKQHTLGRSKVQIFGENKVYKFLDSFEYQDKLYLLGITIQGQIGSLSTYLDQLQLFDDPSDARQQLDIALASSEQFYNSF